MAETTFEGKRALIADDEGPALESLKRLVEAMFPGVEVDAARNAAQALDCVASRMYDLAILDVRMPGEFSGLDVLRTIRAGFDFPVIVISGYGTTDMVLEAMRLGATDFIPKPVDAERLRQDVMRAFQVRQALSDPQAERGFETAVEVRMKADSAALAKLHNLAMNHLSHFDLAPNQLSGVWFCLHEAVKNAIRHGVKEAAGSWLTVRLLNRPGGVEVEVTDEGEGFDWKAEVEKAKQGSGQTGIGLIQALMDEVRFNEKGNQIVFSLAR